MTSPTRPLLRYHGGKWKLAPWIISHFPSHRIYVEPYGGGASVLLRKQRSYGEIYNDLDDEIVNLFQVVRDHGPELAEKLRLTPFARREFVEAYTPTEDPVERARRTLIKANMGFGGNGCHMKTGFRSDTKRSGTTPSSNWANMSIEMSITRLAGVVIENRDAIEVIRQHDSRETLHYIDPPYVKETRDKGDDYRFEMTDEDHRALAAVLHGLKGMVIVSGYSCPLYDELFRDWIRDERAALADGARKRTEVLWMN